MTERTSSRGIVRAVAPRDAAALREKAQAFLVRHGFRPTRQRLLIIDEFLRCDGFVTADDLAFRVRDHGNNSMATVQRTLRLLVQSGIARSRLGDRQFLYEVVGDETGESALVCTRCRRVARFRDPRFDALTREVAARHGFVSESRRLEMHGLCAECATVRTTR